MLLSGTVTKRQILERQVWDAELCKMLFVLFVYDGVDTKVSCDPVVHLQSVLSSHF